MAISIASTATAQGDTGNPSPTVLTAPTGIQDGDLLICHLTSQAATTWPAGWTDIDTVTTPVFSYLRYRIASSEGSSYSFSGSGGRSAIVMHRVIGMAGSGPIDTHSVTTTASSATVNVSTITPSAANSALFFFASSGAGGTCSAYTVATSPPTFTEYSDQSYGGVNSLEASAMGIRAAVTATGSGTATLSVSSSNAGHLLFVKDGSVTLTATQQSYALTFNATLFPTAFVIAIAVANFTLTGISAYITRLQSIWSNTTKVISAWINQSRS